MARPPRGDEAGGLMFWNSDGKLLVPGNSGRSLHGTLQLEARRDQLAAIDQSNQEETVLISRPEGRDVNYRDPVWSPDGSQAVFIEADYTDVEQRSVLVPGDPSNPEIQQHRFARVGGVIDRAIIDEERGWCYFYASPDAKWAIHTYSTLDLPPVHELIEIETHRVVSLLEDNHVIRDRMKSISCQPAEFLKLDIGDGILRYLLENLQLDLCNDELLV